MISGFDRDGLGPLQEKGAAYAYGCVFPEIEFERKRREALAEGREDQAKAYEQARSDARAFFDGLDEEEKTCWPIVRAMLKVRTSRRRNS